MMADGENKSKGQLEVCVSKNPSTIAEETISKMEEDSTRIKKLQTLPLSHCGGLSYSDDDKTPKVEIFTHSPWHRPRPAAMSMDLDDETLMHPMTSSYSVIERRSLWELAEESDNKMLPETADLLTPVFAEMDPMQALLTRQRLTAFMTQDDSGAELPDYPKEPEKWSPLDAEIILQSEGSVMREGDLISFVAEDLQRKIQLSSPVTSSPLEPSSACSTPSVFRPPLRPGQVPPAPPLDAKLIVELETHARHLATSVDTLIENMTGTLHSISSLTVDCVETYRDAVCKTCDAVDSNIKSMYQLMAKTEELSKSMKPIYSLQEQIKEVKRLLELFENVAQSTPST